MPFWDFWTTDRVHEEEHGYIFQKSMGGNGDGANWWTVTEDWPWTTEQFWVPHHCNAEGDVAPLCSFKRSIGHWTQLSWPQTGRIFTANPMIVDLQEKFVNYQGMTRMVQQLFGESADVQTPSYLVLFVLCLISVFVSKTAHWFADDVRCHDVVALDVVLLNVFRVNFEKM